jgi:soluble lytic murein transglycosylase
MYQKTILALSMTFFSMSCQSFALLPFSDKYEIKKGKSILTSYTCEDLIEKADDAEFSLKNLAGLRAMARCPDYKFDFAKLSDFERKLYSQEIESFNNRLAGPIVTEQLSVPQLQKNLAKEKNPEIKFSLHKQIRSRLKRGTDRKAYLESTRKMYKWSVANYKSKKKNADSAAILYEAAQISARTFWTDDDGKTASTTIDEAIKLLGSKNSVAELHYLKGRIHDEAKNYTEAVASYDLAIADVQKFSSKNSFSMDRVMWLKAWILYKEKNHVEAEKAFASLAASTTDLSEKSRAQFYQARCLKSLEREPEAKVLLETIIQEDFFGYYGLVAYRELGRKLPALSSFKTEGRIAFDAKLEKLAEPHRNIYFDLIKYREYGLAEKAIPMMSQSKEDDINLSVYIAQKANIYMPLFRTFARLDNNDKKELFIKHPELIFPRPYQDEVEDMSSKTNLSPSLIYSIMKQESAFNEKARSHADAMGLMQVIPRLARQLSKKFEVPFNANDDLYDPAINIQLGSYELMEQVRKQNGQLTYVAAAYNAGPNALSGWLKNRNRDDVLEFIEEIPYDETRTYVKLIARNKVFYERISKRDSEHDFPANFLN